MNIKIHIKSLVFLLFICSSTSLFAQNSTKFKVVLDAGHGGKDPGTMRGNIKEKDIALDVVLKLGKILEKNKDITVIYTRKTDVFVELRERANIANKAKANLFISVHCNGVTSTQAKGTETFVMGMSRADTNFDISKKENGVIFLEENYNEKYKGFNPNNPETLMGLKILQEEFLNQSIELASSIENNFVTENNRYSRGVKQQPIWVLDATVMPGVLIELGFVSHPEEGKYLNSDNGKDEMAKSISNAILSYKNKFYSSDFENDTQNNSQTNTEIKTSNESNTSNVSSTDNRERHSSNEKGLYKVQICALSKKVSTKSSNFKGLKPISYKKEKKIYKYFYGKEWDYETCKVKLEEAKNKGFTTAFIVKSN
jgi:N-acetylmuramoyl-L-alanine amidase